MPRTLAKERSMPGTTACEFDANDMAAIAKGRAMKNGDHNGALTEALLRVWNNGACVGKHGGFHARIRASLPASQSPNLFALGQAGVVLAQEPFTV